ncbi:MAG: CCA tRNA nucleotidyltransferase, partial [Deltaproteobacteria bacterium]|nr:CCA tRNA nucleotidyltransferase [Deltaproteobacteria bacterium]
MLTTSHFQQLRSFYPDWDNLCRLAAEQHRPLYLVGGAIRDLLRGCQLHELDFACPAADLPAWEKIFLTSRPAGRFISLGRDEFFVRRLVGGGPTLDLAVLSEDDLNLDLGRRDFTINAMAWDLSADRGYDPFGGAADLKARIISCVKARNLADDPLRVLRAVRFAGVLEARIDNSCLEAMRAA